MTEDSTGEPGPNAKDADEIGAGADEAVGNAAGVPVGGQTSPRRHLRLAGALIGVLIALLGFGIAVQVHSNSSADSLTNAREDDLIRILDDQNSRADRLRQQISALQTTVQQLTASGGRDAVAQQQAEQESQALAVLLGTVAATGPGVEVTITDPQHGLKAEDLLDVIEELRGAGAEAIEFAGVRVGTSTAFQDGPNNSIEIDGTKVQAPYDVLAIGDPQTLETALEIPGGVAATARAAGGDAIVRQSSKVDIEAVRTVPSPRYAKPATK